MNKKPIYVIGHKNPDTDSICSAIAYANLKNQLDPENTYIPRRAGHTNPETKYVLKKFRAAKPVYLDTLEPRICDVERRITHGISQETSLKRAWEQMNAENLRTLPIIEDGTLIGLITQGDIARSMMEEHSDTALSSSSVSCRNILDTLDAELIVGDPDAVFKEGTLSIGAANPEVMIQHIQPHSMVIMGNRSDAQIGALEQGADWLIVSLGSEVFDVIKMMAQARGCNIIVTPYSTYQTARLINQSMPVRHVMHTGDLVYVQENDYVNQVRHTMTKHRLRYFPVLSKSGKFKGLISQRNLLNLEQQKVILVDHNEEEQAADGIDNAEILEVIDHHRIGAIPTTAPVYFRNQPLGCTCTIIAQMYKENHVPITPDMAGLMCSAILSDTLCFKSPTCTPLDESTARELAEIAEINVEEHAINMFRAGSEFDNKTEEEILYQDFKAFSVEGQDIGVGQLQVMGADSIKGLEDRMLPFIKDMLDRTHFHVIILMLTDIMSETTRALYVCNAKQIDFPLVMSDAFNVEAGENSADLPGVLSRKKQLMPSITTSLHALM